MVGVGRKFDQGCVNEWGGGGEGMGCSWVDVGLTFGMVWVCEDTRGDPRWGKGIVVLLYFLCLVWCDVVW